MDERKVFNWDAYHENIAKTDPDGTYWYIHEPLEGEQERRVTTRYYFYGPGQREPKIDWTLIPEIEWLLRRMGEDMNHHVGKHLEDAKNESLPEQVRMHHLDIAFSRVWNAQVHMGVRERNFPLLVSTFQKAGAV